MEQKHLPERIEAKRLYLQKHDLATAETMYDYVDQDRERLGQFLPFPKFTNSVEDEIKYIKMTREGWEKFGLYDFSIFRRADGMYMGNVGVHHISWPDDRCEIGYWILGKFEGQGYMSEAVGALVDQLFRHGFNRIEIRCSSANLRSASVPKRLGFKLEGTLEQDCMENGQYRDTLVFAMLRSRYTVSG